MSCKHMPSVEDMVSHAERELMAVQAVSAGDVVGVVAGTQRSTGSTNFLRLHIAGATEAEEFPTPAAVAPARKERRRRPRYRPAAERRSR